MKTWKPEASRSFALGFLRLTDTHYVVGWKAYDRSVQNSQNVDTLLVGHSLGTALALRLAERANNPYTALFLVAGFVGKLGLPEFDPLIESFFDAPLDWDRIRNGSKHCECWAGDNDPYVPLERSRILAERLRAPLHVVSDGGHINSESGYSGFTDILNSILNVSP